MKFIYGRLRDANEARQKEWDRDGKIDLSYRGNEMGGEVGEALEQALLVIAAGAAAGRAQNVIKKIERERRGIRGSRATLDQLADELADVVICADLIAMGEGIDLDAAVRRKFNRTSEANGLQTRMVEPSLPVVGERPA